MNLKGKTYRVRTSVPYFVRKEYRIRLKAMTDKERYDWEQNKLWWKLKKHFVHVEYFEHNGEEYRFDGINLTRQ